MLFDCFEFEGATPSDVKALEQSLHSLTQNNFTTLVTDIEEVNGNQIVVKDDYFRMFDSVYIKDTEGIRDGLYYVKSVVGHVITIDYEARTSAKTGTIALVEYPSDVVIGAKRVFEAMQERQKSEKRGIKSESIGRMSITYETNADSERLINGVDAKLYSFLEPYRKLGW